MPENGLLIAGALSVVGQYRRVGIAARLKSGEQTCVQLRFAVRGDPGRYRHAD